ncbi:MAG: sugar transferase [Rhodobacterales bacterium]|nr:MAG: sugar transferase [Rhodobacterales bacterium]
MTPAKRTADLLLAITMALLLSPLIIGIALAILITDGRPVLFGHTRSKTPDEEFTLWKFRTMHPARNHQDHGVSGGHKRRRITRTGALLRKTRLDELPQLWNVIHGDISFVGPRPPDPRYVRMFPELYAEVLKSRPGITGLATVVYHKTEDRLLAECKTPQQTEAVYTRRCVPRKAKLDLIYAENRTLVYDAVLLFHTVFRVLPLHLKKWR